MPFKINCWCAKSNWFSLGQVVKLCNYSVGDKDRSCLSNEMMEERKWEIHGGIPGNHEQKPAASSDGSQSHHWRLWIEWPHQYWQEKDQEPQVEQLSSWHCSRNNAFNVFSTQKLSPVIGSTCSSRNPPFLARLCSQLPCLQHKPPSCTCPCAEGIDNDIWKFISILPIFLAQKIAQKCTLLLCAFLQVLLDHL